MRIRKKRKKIDFLIENVLDYISKMFYNILKTFYSMLVSCILGMYTIYITMFYFKFYGHELYFNNSENIFNTLKEGAEAPVCMLFMLMIALYGRNLN